MFKAKTKDSELSQTSTVEEHWISLKDDNLLLATKQVGGVSSNHLWRKQAWWGNNQVEEAVREKRGCFKFGREGAVGLHTTKPSVHPIMQYTRQGVRLCFEK